MYVCVFVLQAQCLKDKMVVMTSLWKGVEMQQVSICVPLSVHHVYTLFFGRERGKRIQAYCRLMGVL